MENMYNIQWLKTIKKKRVTDDVIKTLLFADDVCELKR